MQDTSSTAVVDDAVMALADLPAGPVLASALAAIDLSSLNGWQAVEVLEAWHRKSNHDRGALFTVVGEVLRHQKGDARVMSSKLDEYATDEVRAALRMTRAAARDLCILAWDVLQRLPRVHEAMLSGLLDQTRAGVFSEYTGCLAQPHTDAIVAALLPKAHLWTPTQLRDAIARHAIALDPTWAKRLYESARKGRRVVARVNREGTANLAGHDLPLGDVAAASARLDALARAAKAAGHAGRIDHLRADLFLGLLLGYFNGMTDQQIINALLTTNEQHPPDETDTDGGSEHDGAADTDTGGDDGSAGGPGSGGGLGGDGGSSGDDGDGPGGGGSGVVEPNDSESSDDIAYGPAGDPGSADPGRADGHGDAPEHTGPTDDDRTAGDTTAGATAEGDRAEGDRAEGAESAHGAVQLPEPSQAPVAFGRRGGLRLVVGLGTLLGADGRPGELLGYGPTHAELCRDLALSIGSWWCVLTNPDGTPKAIVALRRRPAGASNRYPGEVWIEVDQQTLDQQTLDQQTLDRLPDPGGGDDWAPVLTETIARLRRATIGPPSSDPSARLPNQALRRWIQIRDRYCTFPGCRVPAHVTDVDHTTEHSRHGPTIDINLGSACRHDHGARHKGRWHVHRNLHGTITWISRLGRRHTRVQPPEPPAQPLPQHHYGPDLDYHDWADNDPATCLQTPPVQKHEPQPPPVVTDDDETPPF